MNCIFNYLLLFFLDCNFLIKSIYSFTKSFYNIIWSWKSQVHLHCGSVSICIFIYSLFVPKSLHLEMCFAVSLYWLIIFLLTTQIIVNLTYMLGERISRYRDTFVPAAFFATGFNFEFWKECIVSCKLSYTCTDAFKLYTAIKFR